MSETLLCNFQSSSKLEIFCLVKDWADIISLLQLVVQTHNINREILINRPVGELCQGEIDIDSD